MPNLYPPHADVPESCGSPPLPLPPRMMTETWISVAETAALLHLKPTIVIERIESGALKGRIPEEMPFTYDGKQNYTVLLECLSQRHQYAYRIAHLPPDEVLSLDLASPRSIYGEIWKNTFIDKAKIVQEAVRIRQSCRSTGTVTKELGALAQANGMSLAALYRLLEKPNVRQASLLYLDPVYLQPKLPRTMCLWSADFAYARYLDEHQEYSHNDIFRELESLRSRVSCQNCPYHPDHPSASETLSPPPCVRHAVRDSSAHPVPTQMIVPNNRRTVNRLLACIPKQLLCYCREGVRAWHSRFGYFALRFKPLMVNDNWQGDHHVFDLFVRVRISKQKNDRTYEREIAVRPVLTAWMDSATGCIVGWVISVLPNSDTIAEAFCRACVFTVGEAFHGMPNSILVDCGKDYRSALLQDVPLVDGQPYWSDAEDICLNRRFAGLGLLHSLNVTVHHALPYHPQSKSIERCFGILEQQYINKLPGWCHNNTATRPAGFERHLQKLLEDKTLLAMEDFILHFRERILPSYHGSLDEPTTHPELPGWILNLESMSPMQRYNTLEKSRRLTPDWATMSILKLHHKEGCLIQRNGIRFGKVYYQHSALAGHGGKLAGILYHAVNKPYTPSSITVICENRFLCEAFPADPFSTTDESRYALQAHMDAQNAPIKEMRRTIAHIKRSAYAFLPTAYGKGEYPPIDQNVQLREEIYGAEIDYEKDAEQGKHKSIASIFDTLLGADRDKADPELSEDALTSADSHQLSSVTGSARTKTSRSDIKRGLCLLFGEDDE